MMPDQDKQAVELSAGDLKALSLESLESLHQKYGLDVQIRSSRVAIDQILKEIGREGPGAAAEFTRGFDRTSGGFDRYYNRDIPTMERLGDEVINPADLGGLQRRIERPGG
jgi:hypothetical protein